MRAMKVHLVLSSLIVGAGLVASLTGEQIRLRDSVEVSGAAVLLSDLLPADTPSQMREISTKIELCRAPQPGTLRTLRQDQILAAMRSHSDLLPTITVPSKVLVRSGGWTISEGCVRNAISEFLRKKQNSASLENAAIILPEFLAATEPNYQLEVTRIRTGLFKPEVEAEVRCVSRQSCGAFLVRLTSPNNEASQLNLARTISSPADKEKLPDNRQPRLVAQGKPATLILEDSTTRISLPVICLASGGLNERVRVIDKRSRKIYAAEVVGDQLLRANL
jgi:hypothetical protein